MEERKTRLVLDLTDGEIQRILHSLRLTGESEEDLKLNKKIMNAYQKGTDVK